MFAGQLVTNRCDRSKGPDLTVAGGLVIYLCSKADGTADLNVDYQTAIRQQ
jgi:hypothetical protein